LPISIRGASLNRVRQRVRTATSVSRFVHSFGGNRGCCSSPHRRNFDAPCLRASTNASRKKYGPYARSRTANGETANGKQQTANARHEMLDNVEDSSCAEVLASWVSVRVRSRFETALISWGRVRVILRPSILFLPDASERMRVE